MKGSYVINAKLLNDAARVEDEENESILGKAIICGYEKGSVLNSQLTARILVLDLIFHS